MATVRQALTLQDKMSPVLSKIMRSMESTLQVMERMNTAAGRGIPASEFAAARRQIEAANSELENFNRTQSETISSTTAVNSGFSKLQATIVTINQGLQLAKSAISAAAGALTAASDMSDQQSRLNNAIDASESLYDVQQKIMQSAMDTRSSYESTVDSVVSMKNALGTSTDSAIRMAELMNKSLMLGGTKGAAAESIMYNLQQSLASGNLRWEDWKIVASNSMYLANVLANDFGVTRAELNKMVQEGKVSAADFANALLRAGEKIDTEFENMPDTFTDWMTHLKTFFSGQFLAEGGLQDKLKGFFASDTLLKGIDVAKVAIKNFLTWAGNQVDKIMSALESSGAEKFVKDLMTIGTILGSIIGLLVSVGSAVISNWDIISPILYGVLGIIAVMNAKLAVQAAMWLWNSVLVPAYTAVVNFLSIGFGVLSGSTAAASAAQLTYNSALYACPITWIILLIIALIAILFAVVAVINKVTDAHISALGIITGSLAVAGAFIWNLVIGLLDSIIQALWTVFVEPWIGIVEWVLNVFNGGFNSFGDAVKNLLGNIISWFLSLGKIVTKIIDAIFGTNWTEGLTSLQDSVSSWGKNENSIKLSREAPSIGANRISYGGAWNSGYSWGERAGNSISNKLSNLTKSTSGVESAAQQIAAIENNGGNGNGITNVSGSTVSISDEDLKYLRDIAEVEYINRYTTMRPIVNANFGDVRETADVNKVLEVLESVVEESFNSSLARG